MVLVLIFSLRCFQYRRKKIYFSISVGMFGCPVGFFCYQHLQFVVVA